MKAASLAVSLLIGPLLLPAGCHSHRIDVTVVNRTGSALRLVEVDYPSASFGANALGAGETISYPLALRGSGTLTVQYTQPDGAQIRIPGPELREGQEGDIQVLLFAGGRADFRPSLNPPR